MTLSEDMICPQKDKYLQYNTRQLPSNSSLTAQSLGVFHNFIGQIDQQNFKEYHINLESTEKFRSSICALFTKYAK